MKRLLKNGLLLLLIFCFGIGILYACSKTNNDIPGNVDFTLISTGPAENTVVSSSATESVVFVFDKGVFIADESKITLNTAPVQDAAINGTSLTVKLSALVSNTDYTLTIGIGAIRDGSGNLNKTAFSYHFKTAEVPVVVTGGAVSQNGFLSVKGTSLVNQDGNTLVLHGVSLGWHNWWPRFYNENTISWLKTNWKCDYIRAAIGVDADQNCYIANPISSLNCLDTVVEAAIKNDMYVIVDWHASAVYTTQAQGFFQTVAQKYGSNPNIIYEIFNEPDNTVLWSSVKTYAEAVIGTIRAIDPKNIILVGSPSWDQQVNLPAADPITDYSNLMYTLHFYAATHKQSLRDVATAALQKGLPLFVSECGGMEASGDGDINTTEWNSWLQWMSQNNISWDAWCIADKAESCSMIKDTSSPVSGWTDNDLKEWGLIVRAEISGK